MSARRAAALRWAPGARRRPPSVIVPLGDADAGRGEAPLPETGRILVVRPDHLGDVLLSGPALAALRAARPGARIDLMVGPWSAAVAARLPGPDEVRTADLPPYRRGAGPSRLGRLAALPREARRLRSARYDAALVLRDDDYWGAWLAALAGIPLRIGHDEPGPRPFLSHALAPAERPAHVAAAALALVAAAVGAPAASTPESAPLRIALRPEDHEAAARAMAALPKGRAPLAIHPGSGAAVKAWRPDDWAEVARALTQDGETVLLTGGPGEREEVAELAALLGRPTLDLAGRTELGGLAAVYARCRLVLGVDSGPLHLATAVGTPSVRLYGPADADRFGPWGAPARHAALRASLPCAPCGRLDWDEPEAHPCVRLVPPRRVIAAAEAVAGPAARRYHAGTP